MRHISPSNNKRKSRNTAGRIISRRFDSLRLKVKQQDEGNSEEVPEAKVDIAFVGVEYAGKSTFFKQITSCYTPQDFQALVSSDGKSQAVGTLLKITLNILKNVETQLVTWESKKAAELLLESLSMYNLTPRAVEAIKSLWTDVIFLAEYRKSTFYQLNSFVQDIVNNVGNLIDDEYVLTKDLHLKLHNPTHGYNSAKFTFRSQQPILTNPIDPPSDDNVSVNSKSINSVGGPSAPSIQTVGTRNTKTRRMSIPIPRRMSIPNILPRMSLTKNVRVKPTPMQDRINDVRLWDIGGLYERRTDWEYFLRKSNVAMFFCSLADYSTSTSDGSDENLLNDSLNMFRVLCETEFLKDRVLTVVLTKIDIFMEKLVRMKVPLNCLNQFPDAPSGAFQFDVDANIDFVKELFYKVTETKNSFLTRSNLVFKTVNSFDEEQVKEVFVEAVNTIRAELQNDSDSSASPVSGPKKQKGTNLGFKIRNSLGKRSKKIASLFASDDTISSERAGGPKIMTSNSNWRISRGRKSKSSKKAAHLQEVARP